MKLLVRIFLRQIISMRAEAVTQLCHGVEHDSQHLRNVFPTSGFCYVPAQTVDDVIISQFFLVCNKLDTYLDLFCAHLRIF